MLAFSIGLSSAQMHGKDHLTIMDKCNTSIDSSPNFHYPTTHPLRELFELELSTFQHVLVRVPDSKKTCQVQLLPPDHTTTTADADQLRALPEDIIFEILKYLRDSDIRSLRTVSRIWRQTFRNIVHQFPGCAQFSSRKALWISALDSRNGIRAFLSNNQCNRRKLFGKVFRFSEGDLFPVDTRMVASEAGLICLRATFSSTSSAASECSKLIVCNPVLMDFRILPAIEDMFLPEKLLPNHDVTSIRYTNFGLVVDSHSLSYKVIVASPDVNVRVFDSSSRNGWKLGSAPPQGILFSGQKNPVTYKRCLYFVAFDRPESATAASNTGKLWFIMRYNVEKDTWRRLPDVPRVHQMNSWKLCQHYALPDLVTMSDGLVLVAENDGNTSKHIFRFSKLSRTWDLIFHVPIFSGYITSLGPIKCIGIQMNLYFLLQHSLPFLEVDLGSKQWAWCLPVGLHTEHDLKRFSDMVSVKETLPFEPSLLPASEPW